MSKRLSHPRRKKSQKTLGKKAEKKRKQNKILNGVFKASKSKQNKTKEEKERKKEKKKKLFPLSMKRKYLKTKTKGLHFFSLLFGYERVQEEKKFET